MAGKNRDALPEALAYFRREPVLHELLHGLTEKYRSLGRVGGTVILAGKAARDKEVLGGLLGEELSEREPIRVSAAALDKALQKTRFAPLSLPDLLAAFAAGSLRSRAEEKETFETEKEAFFRSFAAQTDHAGARGWLEHLAAKGKGGRGVHLAYRQDRETLTRRLTRVIRALESLPDAYERLPVFASRLTGDPHAFDPQCEQGRLFIAALQFLSGLQDAYLTATDQADLLASFRLVRDDITSFVTCAGLLARNENNKELGVWRQACLENAVLNVPLREMFSAREVRPYRKGGEPAVFAVENSGVFSAILDRFTDAPLPPLLCTHGQLKTAAWLLLDRLAPGVRVYYSGDFDPEGLQIAQGLLRRKPECVLPWRFDPDDYFAGKPSNPVSAVRLRKLAAIDHPALLPLCEEIKRLKLAGYQEQIIERLVADINKAAQF